MNLEILQNKKIKVSQNTYLFVVYVVGKLQFHYKHKNYYMITLRQLIESNQHKSL